jgi:hypothetical protein
MLKTVLNNCHILKSGHELHRYTNGAKARYKIRDPCSFHDQKTWFLEHGENIECAPLISLLYGKIAARSVVPFALIPTALAPELFIDVGSFKPEIGKCTQQYYVGRALARSHFSARKGLKVK